MTMNNFRKDVCYLLLGIHDSTLSFNVVTRKSKIFIHKCMPETLWAKTLFLSTSVPWSGVTWGLFHLDSMNKAVREEWKNNYFLQHPWTVENFIASTKSGNAGMLWNALQHYNPFIEKTIICFSNAYSNRSSSWN